LSDQSTTSCPHVELAVAWALHSLEPAEEALVLAHLPDCSDCIQVAAETEEVGAMLGMAVPESVPSAELEQRVLAVTAEPQVASTEPEVASTEPQGSPAEAEAPQTPEPRTPEQAQEPRNPAPQSPVPPTPEPRTERSSNVAGPWPGPAISRQRRAPGRRSRFDPRCLIEPALMLLVVLVVCAIAVAVVFYGI
jgi:outer membrane biosynthesis protein TonB